MKYKNFLNDEFVWTPIVEPAYWTINLINIRKVRFDEKGKETSEFEKKKKK
jgi:hypothetical protein